MDEIVYRPIGFVRSPYKVSGDAPFQSVLSKEACATIVLQDEFVEGVKALDRVSHIVVLFHFDQSVGFKLVTRTPWSEEERGVFATRSPHRPNGIGLSIVKLLRIEGNVLEIEGVDMLDGTPVLDIKPYSASLNPESQGDTVSIKKEFG